MPAKFGTSGLRGLVEELNEGTAAAHAAAFVAHLKASGAASAGDRVFVGQDLRPSSAEIAAQVMAAIEDEGFVPVDCGTLPTPALAFHAMAAGSASVMVTGSHIPADRNGVKFYRPDGEIDKTDEAEIAARAAGIDRRQMRAAPHHVPDSAQEAATSAYLGRYAGFVGEGALSGLRIGVYQHSTVARDLFAAVFRLTGAELVPLGRSDRFVPVDTEAVDEHTRDRIRVWTERHELDMLVSADGDADRPLLADATGECLRGDVLGLIAARELGAEVIVTPVTSNSGIERLAGGSVVRTRVGSPFVIAGMKAAAEAGSVLGFEANGGVLTGSPFTLGGARLAPLPTRDFLVPILAAIVAAHRAGKPLADLVSGLQLPVAASGRIENFATEKGQALVAALSDDEARRVAFLAPLGMPAAIDRTDGLRMTLAGGRILHLRPSGNAPELRVYTEAATEAEADGLVEAAIARIGEWAATI